MTNDGTDSRNQQRPPLTKTMAIIRWVILGGLVAVALVMGMLQVGLLHWEAKGEKETVYHCPMHPQYVSPRPGECPICGMTLVPVAAGQTPPAETRSRAMHHADSVLPETVTSYQCSMHAEIISQTPGRCPKCGMPLEPVAKKAKDVVPHESGGHPPGSDFGDTSAALGLVPVSIAGPRVQLMGLRTAKVERRRLDDAISLFGTVVAAEPGVRTVNLKVAGWVQRLFVNKTGEIVEKDKPLLSVYSQDLYQAQQDYIIALERKAASDEPLLQKILEQVVSASRERLLLLGLSESQIRQLEQDRQPSAVMTIHSPFSGYVLEKSVSEGQFVMPDQKLMVIADLSQVWVIGEAYEHTLPLVKKGQRATITLVSYPDEEFEGWVSEVYPDVSPSSRTAKVRIELDNPQLKLRPGMYAEVRLRSESQEVLVVPSEAIIDGGLQQYAFVAHSDGHFEPRLLKVGRRTEVWSEILGGLREGEEVVTSGNFLLDSESRLKAAMAGVGTAGEMPQGHRH